MLDNQDKKLPEVFAKGGIDVIKKHFTPAKHLLNVFSHNDLQRARFRSLGKNYTV